MIARRSASARRVEGRPPPPLAARPPRAAHIPIVSRIENEPCRRDSPARFPVSPASRKSRTARFTIACCGHLHIITDQVEGASLKPLTGHRDRRQHDIASTDHRGEGPRPGCSSGSSSTAARPITLLRYRAKFPMVGGAGSRCGVQQSRSRGPLKRRLQPSTGSGTASPAPPHADHVQPRPGGPAAIWPHWIAPGRPSRT